MISIDPGKHSIAWALFDKGQLLKCGLIRAKGPGGIINAADVVLGFMHGHDVVLEVPQVYQQRAQKGDPNDLIDVAIVGGIALALLAPTSIRCVRPREWKGTRSKNICNKLTMSLLEPWETSVLKEAVCPKSLRHNVEDAVGMGLWALGRR